MKMNKERILNIFEKGLISEEEKDNFIYGGVY